MSKTKLTFQSTHRVSDATTGLKQRRNGGGISIHAPRERCDAKRNDRKVDQFRFQSTHRVSDATTPFTSSFRTKSFQSTHRVSDATANKKLKEI